MNIQDYRNKLKAHMALQLFMKEVNAMIKKTAGYEARQEAINMLAKKHGITLREGSIRRILTPDYGERIGYKSYELTNNNAIIKQTSKRIEELEKAEAFEQKAESRLIATEYEGKDCKIYLDFGLNRIQVEHPAKPSLEVINQLKRNGYHWSHTNKVWQRQLTNNAIYATNNLFDSKIPRI